jgi:hypothetical protein
MAHQCPYCPLLFTFGSELELHRREDHRSRNGSDDVVVPEPRLRDEPGHSPRLAPGRSEGRAG